MNRSRAPSNEEDEASAYDRGVRDSTQRLRQLVQQTSIASPKHAAHSQYDFLPGIHINGGASGAQHAPTSSSRPKRQKKSIDLSKPVLARSRSAYNEDPSSSQKPVTRPRNKTIGSVDQEQPSPKTSRSRTATQSTVEESRPSALADPSTVDSQQYPPAESGARPPTSPIQVSAADASLITEQPEQRSNAVSSQVPPPNARYLAHLMSRTRGHMQGYLYYRIGSSLNWARAYCILCSATGSLLSDSGGGRYADEEILVDLHGCRVQASYDSETRDKTIHVSGKSQQRVCHLRPVHGADFDSWFTALVCWQAIPRARSLELDLTDAQLTPIAVSSRKERRRSREDRSSRESSIVKTAKFILWYPEQGARSRSKAISRFDGNEGRIPGQDSTWLKVSCILNENGDFKLLTNADAKEVAMIPLGKLPRSAVQRLSPSVLKADHVIAVFPQYSSDLRSLARLQPLYLSCESKPQYELWFVLLRAFTVPELYGPAKNKEADSLRSQESLPGLSSGVSQSYLSSLFRVERSLELQILEYKDIPLSDGSDVEDDPPSNTPLDPSPSSAGHYAQVLVDGVVRAKTRTKRGILDAVWYESVELLDLPPTASFVTIQVWRTNVVTDPMSSAQTNAEPTTFFSTSDEDSSPKEYLIGEMLLPLGDAHKMNEDTKTQWSLIDEEGRTNKTLSLKLRLNRDIVLADQEYSVMSELLHEFSNALTLQIADVIPTELSRLSDCLLNIFQVSGGAKDWLVSLAEEEIDGIRKPIPTRRIGFGGRLNSKDSKESLRPQEREGLARDITKATIAEANLLFRGNTLLSKALDAHMQRLGRDYLEETLGEKLREIAELDQDVEVDPTRISATASLHFNWLRLLDLVHSIWALIRKSASKCPGELRGIFRHIKSCAEEKYAYCLKTVPYSSVSGFVFLRFFCPAILNPVLFDLLTDNPTPRAQRSFTLIAKTLQGLANQSTFGSKEPWMEPMNNFLNTHKADFRDFIDEICMYASDGTSASSSQYYAVALSTFSRLPTACKEGYLSLPCLIDETRAFAALIDIWLGSFSPQSIGQPLETELLQFHNECLNLRKKTQDLFRHAERGAKRSGVLEEKWKALLVHMQTNPEEYWIGFSPYAEDAAPQTQMQTQTQTNRPTRNVEKREEGHAPLQPADGVAFASDPPRPSATPTTDTRPRTTPRWRSRSHSRTASPLRTGEYDSGPSGAEEEPSRPEQAPSSGKVKDGKRPGLFGRRRRSDR